MGGCRVCRSLDPVKGAKADSHRSDARDLEGGLSKDLKDGERGLRRANAGGSSWRY